MNWLIAYLAFSISTGLVCWWLFYRRALQEVAARNIKNVATKRPVLSGLVYILLSARIAPLLLAPIFSNTCACAFYESTLNELLKPD